MIDRKEWLSIASIALVIGLVISLSAESIVEWQKTIFRFIILSFFVIIINVLAKKIIAFYFGAKIEIETWKTNRLAFRTKNKFFGYKPTPNLRLEMLLGFFMPLLVKILSFGFLNWMACLTFDAKGTVYRTARKHELYQFSDVTEKELSWIAWGSLMVNLFFGFIAYLINAPFFSYINF